MRGDENWSVTHIPVETKKYIVMRKDAIYYGERVPTINSSYFPVVVEVCGYHTPEEILRQAFEQRGWPDYKGRGHKYIITEMIDPVVVSIVPRQDYDIKVEPF